MTSLLDAAHLDGRFFDGHWIEGGQGYDVLEPATGAVLARAASVDAATVTKTATALAPRSRAGPQRRRMSGRASSSRQRRWRGRMPRRS